MSLKKFIEEENSFATKFPSLKGMPTYDIDALTDKEAQKMFARLDNHLSPENLHQDGERTAAKAERYRKLYTAAIKDLQKKGFKYKGKFHSFEA